MVRPRVIEHNAHRKPVRVAVATDHATRDVAAATGAHRREEQQQRFGLIQGILADRAHAAARDIQNMQAHQATGISFGNTPANRLDGHSDDRPAELPPFLLAKRRLTHGRPPRQLCKNLRPLLLVVP